MNAENVAKMLAATVAPERELAAQAEAQLEEMQKVILLVLRIFKFLNVDNWFPWNFTSTSDG